MDNKWDVYISKMFHDSSDSDSDDSSVVIINDESNGVDTSDSEPGDSETDQEIDTDSDSDLEFEEFIIEPDDDEYDEIYQEDSYHIYSEKENDHYYIGLAKRISTETLLMVNSVSASTFFMYSFARIRDYLAKYSIINIQNAKVHIMKLCILPDETYSVILKTHWIRLVQRTWKKVYKERKRVLKQRRKIKNLFLREINGRYPSGMNYVPSIHGMMSQYK
jgi:hypothetical protein